MNILILFSQPWRVGGAETHVEALIQGLSKNNKLFLAVNEGSDKARLAAMQAKYGLEVIYIQARGINIFRWYMDIRKLAALVREEHIAVISAQQRTAGIWANYIKKQTGVPFVVTMHDPWHRAKFKLHYRKIFSRVIVVSQNLAKVLQAEFGFAAANIQLINNGIDFTRFKPEPKKAVRKSLSLPQDKKIILHVSRLSNVKGAVALRLVEAFSELIKVQPDCELIIIGEGPMREQLNLAVESFNKQYGKKIIVKDFVNDIIEWYNAADMLVGEGRVAIEAMACEKPIVAIRNGKHFIGAISSQNIAYACDVNFDSRDKAVEPSILAAEMQQALLSAPAEARAIADYIKGRMSLEKMAAGYMSVFKEVIK